jgi:RNA polymerase sigma-70 factor (ECF subfamily)
MEEIGPSSRNDIQMSSGNVPNRTAVEHLRAQLPVLLPRLRRFARAIAKSGSDADDVVQIAIERALIRIDQWDSSLRLESWMFGIVRNAWIDEVRSRSRRNELFAPAELGESVGVDSLENQASIFSVQAAMSRLPEEQRTAVALVLVEGLSYKEAAATMDIPIGTLTSRLARGRDALQKMLGEPAGAQS